MSKLRNKLKIIACGGAGAKIIGAVKPNGENGKAILNRELSNIVNVEVVHIDTDDKSNVFDSDLFYHLHEEKISNSIGDGGAGGVATEKKDMLEVQLAELAPKLIKDEPNTIFVLLSSATGGSGRMISLYLTKYFMQLQVPFMPMVVLDSTEEEHANNSIKTLKTFRIFAKQINYPLNIWWKDNIDGVSNVDDSVIGLLTALGVFTSEYLNDIEISDMRNFFRMYRYNIASIPNGLYYTNIKYGNHIIEALRANDNIAMARILADDSSLDKTGISKRSDVGTPEPITLEVIQHIGAELPIALYSESGVYSKTLSSLEVRYEELKNPIMEESIPEESTDDGFIL